VIARPARPGVMMKKRPPCLCRAAVLHGLAGTASRPDYSSMPIMRCEPALTRGAAAAAMRSERVGAGRLAGLAAPPAGRCRGCGAGAAAAAGAGRAASAGGLSAAGVAGAGGGGEDLLGHFLDRADHQQRLSADDPHAGLAVLGSPQPGDVLGHHEVIAAARFELDEFHGRKVRAAVRM